MYLSALQRYILKQTYINGPQCSRSFFNKFYPRTTSGAGRGKKSREQEIKIITVSLERLIAKGLIRGYGYKTATKLFLDKVSLMPAGRKVIKKLLDDQQRLPLKRGKR